MNDVLTIWGFVAGALTTVGFSVSILPRVKILTIAGAFLIGGIIASFGVTTVALGFKILGHNADWHYSVLGLTLLPPAVSIIIALARYRHHRESVYYHVFKRPMKE